MQQMLLMLSIWPRQSHTCRDVYSLFKRLSPSSKGCCHFYIPLHLENAYILVYTYSMKPLRDTYFKPQRLFTKYYYIFLSCWDCYNSFCFIVCDASFLLSGVEQFLASTACPQMGYSLQMHTWFCGNWACWSLKQIQLIFSHVSKILYLFLSSFSLTKILGK